MRFAYLANVRLPGERAHANQTVQMCAALAAAGVNVELFHPRRSNYPEFRRINDVWTYYGVPHNFDLRPVSGSIELFDLMNRVGWRGRGLQLAFVAQLAGYSAALVPSILRMRADVYYTRDITTLALLRLLRPRRRRSMFYEAHTFPGSRAGVALHRAALPGIGGLVAITRGLADEFTRLGVQASRLCVAPDAVDPARFGNCSRADARRRLGWPADRMTVVYAGHFYAWKGVDTLIAAMGDSPAQLYLVGGTPEMVVKMRARLNGVENMHVVGWVAPAQVPLYLAAADVLALPNSGREAISRRHTSPLKMFEYMAAARPIVASDLPSLRETLTDGENALLVPPDDPAALARGIERALGDPALAGRLAERARRVVEAFTWVRRADRVLAFVRECLVATN